MAKALILRGLFAEFPTQSCWEFCSRISSRAGNSNLGAGNLAPSRKSQPGETFWGARARLVGGRRRPGPRLRRWQAYTALLMMCRSRPRLSLRPRPKAQVRPRPAVRLSVADRVLDQFPADGAEENYLYCNPTPNGDKPATQE
jgi:hypothetical protein